MAMLDYGAILRVDGKVINKDVFMMDSSDTGYVCEKAVYAEGADYDGEEVQINGNYFVYAGDKHFLLCFYKGICQIISEEKIIDSVHSVDGMSETRFNKDLPNVTIEYLDKNWHLVHYEKPDRYDIDCLKYQYGAKWYMHYLRACKKSLRVWYKTHNYRYLATWSYNGHSYEVIYGYGIDSNRKFIWNDDLCDSYDFTISEKQIIRAWFNEKD